MEGIGECPGLNLLRLGKDTFPKIDLELKSIVKVRPSLGLSKSPAATSERRLTYKGQ